MDIQDKILSHPCGYVINQYKKYNIQLSNEDKNWIKIKNIGNALGIFPGIGVIVGIARVLFFGILLLDRKLAKTDKPYAKLQVLRGLMEISTILSPVILIADIATTIFQYTHDYSKEAKA